jgi:hypothetical protein
VILGEGNDFLCFIPVDNPIAVGNQTATRRDTVEQSRHDIEPIGIAEEFPTHQVHFGDFIGSEELIYFIGGFERHHLVCFRGAIEAAVTTGLSAFGGDADGRAQMLVADKTVLTGVTVTVVTFAVLVQAYVAVCTHYIASFSFKSNHSVSS